MGEDSPERVFPVEVKAKDRIPVGDPSRHKPKPLGQAA